MTTQVTLESLLMCEPQENTSNMLEETIFESAADVLESAFDLNFSIGASTTVESAQSIAESLAMEASVMNVLKIAGAVVVGAVLAIITFIILAVAMIIKVIIYPFEWLYKQIRGKFSDKFKERKDDITSIWETGSYSTFRSTENTRDVNDFEKSINDYADTINQVDETNRKIAELTEKIRTQQNFNDTLDELSESKFITSLRDVSPKYENSSPNAWISTTSNLAFADGPTQDNVFRFVQLIDKCQQDSTKQKRQLEDMQKSYDKLEKVINDKVYESLDEDTKTKLKEVLAAIKAKVVYMSKQSSKHAQDISCLISNTTQILHATGYKFNEYAKRGLDFANEELDSYTA